jgi:hypothetical protein
MMLDLWDDHTFYTYLYLIIYYFYTCYSQYIVMYKYVSLLIFNWSLNIFRPYINLYIEIENLYFVSNCVTKLLFILLNCSCVLFIYILFNLNNIYLENDQNIQYIKPSKYRQDSETYLLCLMYCIFWLYLTWCS